MDGDASDGGFQPSRSAPALPWQVSQVGHLSPDQSYLGRPRDPEIVQRVRGSLNKYTGPRTLAEHEAIIAKKAEEKQRKAAEQSAEYYAWASKVKQEVVPSFKLPDDPRKGMPSNEEQIKKKVKAGLRDMRDKNVDYKAWIDELRTKQAFKLHQKLHEKADADQAFNNAALLREQNRAKRDAEIRDKVAETQSQYWNWLRGMKTEVAKRPNSAPPPTASTLEATLAAAEKKKRDMNAALKTMRAEYSEWLNGVKEQKYFTLPPPVCTLEQDQARAVRHKESVENFHKSSADYFDNVKKIQAKHHERIMRNVKLRDEADQAFNQGRANAAAGLEAKMEEEKQRAAVVAQKSRQELKEMYERVKAKPMFLELAYNQK